MFVSDFSDFVDQSQSGMGVTGCQDGTGVFLSFARVIRL